MESRQATWISLRPHGGGGAHLGHGAAHANRRAPNAPDVRVRQAERSSAAQVIEIYLILLARPIARG